MEPQFRQQLQQALQHLKDEGLYKLERPMTSPQRALIRLGDREVLNFCSNNYLGLAEQPMVIAAAKAGLDQRGFGMASVRFICGTQDQHRQLEQRLAAFLQKEDAILFSSCFDANLGLFEALLGPEDAVISDSLNHASIIDGVRLCKARRYRYASSDMQALEQCLEQARVDGARHVLIATDGVFSMDGVIAPLAGICDLAARFNALVMVDDSHGVGVLGEHGRGSPEHCGVLGRVDILTGTLGKALGGASGGYVAGPHEVVEWLRQRARPYLFSNALAPAVVAASLQVLTLLEDECMPCRRLQENGDYFRSQLAAAGFTLTGSGHPIIPILLGDAHLAGEMAARLLDEGIYVVPFSYPVVSHNEARIRVQLSVAHSREQLDEALAAIIRVGRRLKVIKEGT